MPCKAVIVLLAAMIGSAYGGAQNPPKPPPAPESPAPPQAPLPPAPPTPPLPSLAGDWEHADFEREWSKAVAAFEEHAADFEAMGEAFAEFAPLEFSLDFELPLDFDFEMETPEFDLSDLDFEDQAHRAELAYTEALETMYSHAGELEGALAGVEEDVGVGVAEGVLGRVAELAQVQETRLGELRLALQGVTVGVGATQRGLARMREEALYERGQRALNRNQFEEAITYFSEIASRKERRAAGALHWKAYAQYKLGQRDEALATLNELRTGYPNSRWLNSAQALEVEIRQSEGQPVSPEDLGDELKATALRGLLQADPERGVPLAEEYLQGNHSPQLRAQALFVLARTDSPRAREIVREAARGQYNPDLQRRALRYVGQFRGEDNRQLLAEVYASTDDPALKRSILQGFRNAKDVDRLFAAARNEQDPELRAYAAGQLGRLRAKNELRQLYQSESSGDVKKQIVHGLAQAQDIERVLQIARSDSDMEVRLHAIDRYGHDCREAPSEPLVEIYRGDTNPEIRKMVMHALRTKDDAKTLVALARQESDPELVKEAVENLSRMKSKEATDYLLELLSK